MGKKARKSDVFLIHAHNIYNQDQGRWPAASKTTIINIKGYNFSTIQDKGALK